jgi:hypothetical protein
MSSSEKQQSPSSSTLFSKKRGLSAEKKRSKKKAKKQKLESSQQSITSISSKDATGESKSKNSKSVLNKNQRAASSDAIEERKLNKKSKDTNTEVVATETIKNPVQEEMEEVVEDILLQQDLVADSQYDEIIQPSLTPDIKQIRIPKVIPHDSIHPVVADTFEQRAIDEPSVGYLSNNNTVGENVILSHQVNKISVNMLVFTYINKTNDLYIIGSSSSSSTT